ncbi:MAG: phytanoyl-CoA dioxygenase family protein, partial [Actinomycetota bacterium]|nr:phytanoyl-CoA dioxygenase family protein [Actinomycetota bacterium]
MSALLTDEQIASFERDGFVVVPDFMGSQTRASIRERAIDLVDNWEPSGENTVFTTEEQERVSNHEFLSSGGRIWCFFEEEA